MRVFLYSLMISALCHFHLVRFIVRFATPRAFDTPPSPPITLRSVFAVRYTRLLLERRTLPDGRHFKVQLRELAFCTLYLIHANAAVSEKLRYS